MRKVAAKSCSIQVRQTDDGLHLADSILWFDAKDSGDLSFLSSATLAWHPKVPQVIATEETIRILAVHRRKPNALICQYNRPFSIGRLKMELLPSGCVLGGASLYLETDKGRLLYAPQLQSHRIATVRQMQLKRADTLILGVGHADPHLSIPNRKREKDRLLETIQRHVADGRYPVILCEPVGTAQELTKLLSDAGVPLAVYDSIFKVNTVYEDAGSKLGAFARYDRRRTRQKVTLFPLPRPGTPPLRSTLPDGPVLYVENKAEESTAPAAFRAAVERFCISSTCDGPETKDIVAAVGPRELYIFGPYAKRYVEMLDGLAPHIHALFPNDQPTLF